jgi:hypothetical protein
MNSLPSDSPLPSARNLFLGTVFNGMLLFSLADIVAGALTWNGVNNLPLSMFSFCTSLGIGILSTLLLVSVSAYENTPWRPFIPLILVYAWGSIAFLPLPAYTGVHALVPVSVALQALATAHCIRSIRNSFGTRVLLPSNAFFGSRFSWGHCLRAHLVLGGASLAFLGGALLLAVFSLEKLTAGFLRIRPSGVYTETRSYHFKGSTLHLLPSVHIATPAFYEQLVRHFPSEGSVLLPEGVTDRKNVLPKGIDHSVSAKSVGLTPQPQITEIRKTAVRACDVDVSDFSPKTQALLRSFGDLIDALQKHDQSALFQMLSRPVEFDFAVLQKDILENRNARVVAAIEAAQPEYSHIGVPWGAAHMPGIEKEMIARGAQETASQRVQVFAWKDLRLQLP